MAGTWNRSEAIRRHHGVVMFDSAIQPSLAASRGGPAPASSRQFMMRAEEFDIQIKIWGSRDHRTILGQLLPRSGEAASKAARFHLLQHGERIDSTTTDETGGFIFTEVPEGELSLQIDLPNLTVVGALKMKER